MYGNRGGETTGCIQGGIVEWAYDIFSKSEEELFVLLLFLQKKRMHFIIIDGPNLNLTGKREPGFYGKRDMKSFLAEITSRYSDHTIDYFQSNIEGELINKLHASGFSYDGIILNAGGYTHTSVAIGDAVKAIVVPVVEVHLSNVFSREPFRWESFISPGARGVISGFGLAGYRLAIQSFLG